MLSGNSKSCSLGTAEGAVREQQKLFPGNSKSILWEQQKYSLGTAVSKSIPREQQKWSVGTANAVPGFEKNLPGSVARKQQKLFPDSEKVPPAGLREPPTRHGFTIETA